jgi:5'-3' exonuclease
MTHYVLIDGNNIIFASQLSAMGKNPQAKRLFAGEFETTAIYGALTSIREIKNRFPGAKINVLWDTGKVWRYSIYPEYKGNRKENPDIVAAKKALEPQRPYVMQMLQLLGVHQVTAENYEADDIAAYLADALEQRGNQITLVTRDQDWLQMIRPGVTWYDRQADRTVSHLTFEADTGFGSPDEFSEAKVLAGDAGDNVKGIHGVGEKGANALIEAFGTVERFLENWEEWVADGNLVTGHPLKRALKPIQSFLADPNQAKAHMALNRQLMDLRTMYGNKELSKAIRRSGAAYDLEALKPLLGKFAFISILKDATRWAAPFAQA